MRSRQHVSDRDGQQFPFLKIYIQPQNNTKQQYFPLRAHFRLQISWSFTHVLCVKVPDFTFPASCVRTRYRACIMRVWYHARQTRTCAPPEGEHMCCARIMRMVSCTRARTYSQEPQKQVFPFSTQLQSRLEGRDCNCLSLEAISTQLQFAFGTQTVIACS